MPTGNLKPKTRCPDCGSTYVYVRADGSIFCRKCGHGIRLKNAKEPAELPAGDKRTGYAIPEPTVITSPIAGDIR